MSKRSKKIIRRLIAVFIAIMLVAGIGLTHGADRVLYATELDESEYFEEYYDDSVYEEPAYEEYVEEAVYDEAVEYVEPAYEEPVYEEPVYEEPAYEEPAYQEPAYEEPVQEEYVEPVYEEPVEEVYEEPVQAEEWTEETPKPETWLNGYTSKAEISAYAPEGALPEGAYMIVTELADEQVLNAVQTIAAREVSALHGVSIKFYDAYGAQVIPEREVQISINAYGLAGHEAEERSVLAFDYYGNGYIIDPYNAQIGLWIDGTYAQFWAYDWNSGDTFVFASFKDADEGEDVLYTDEVYSEGSEGEPEAEPVTEPEGPQLIFMDEETEEESPAEESSEAESEGPKIIFMEEETEEESVEEVVTEEEPTEEVSTEEESTEEVSTEEESTEEESTEEESTEEETEEVSMPAAEFDDVAPNGIIVHVSAEEGVFPEGTTMVLKDVAPEEVMGAVEGAVEGVVAQVLAVDITFIDKDGNEIQPESGVAVSLSMPQAQTTEEVAAEAAVAVEEVSQEIIHIDSASGEATVMTDAAAISDDGTAAEFVAESFSTYVLITTITKNYLASDGNTYKITIDYTEEAKIPGNATLEVSEIIEGSAEYDAYVENAASALDVTTGEIVYAKLLDINILNADGEKIQPEVPVSVTIELLDKEETDEEESTQVLHFADAVEVIESVDDGTVVNFEAPGFSTYGIVTIITGPTELNGTTVKINYDRWYLQNTGGSIGESYSPVNATEWMFETGPGGYYMKSEGLYLQNKNKTWVLVADQKDATVFEVTETGDNHFTIRDLKNDVYIGRSGNFRAAQSLGNGTDLVFTGSGREVSVSGAGILYTERNGNYAVMSTPKGGRLAREKLGNPQATVWTITPLGDGMSGHMVSTTINGETKYLHIGNDTAFVSGDPQTLYLMVNGNGAIRLSDADGYALNLSSSKQSFGGYLTGDKATEGWEWFNIVVVSLRDVKYVYEKPADIPDGVNIDMPEDKTVSVEGSSYNLEKPAKETVYWEDDEYRYEYEFQGWSINGGETVEYAAEQNIDLSGYPVGSTVELTAVWEAKEPIRKPYKVQYNVIQAQGEDHFGSLSGSLPTVEGADSGEPVMAVPYEEGTEYVVKALTDPTYLEYDGKRYYYKFEFDHWELEDGSTVYPGDEINLSQMQDVNNDDIITFTSRWKSSGWKGGAGRPWVNFMIWSDVSSAEEIFNNGGSFSEDTVNYVHTGGQFATTMQALDGEGNVIPPSELHSPADGGKKFFLISYSGSTFDDANQKVIQLASPVGYSSWDQYNGDVIWQLASLPSDEEVFASLRNSNSRSFKINGKVIEPEELIPENYYIDWVSVKYQSSNVKDGWHIDGVLVKRVPQTIEWLNWDNSLLYRDANADYGRLPEYKGIAPTRPAPDNDHEYVFTGWDPELVPVTGPATYTAQYELKNKYTVTFLDDNGQELKSEKVVEGTQISSIEPNTPSKEETDQYIFVFDRWVTADEGSDAPETVTRNITLKATYKETLKEYTVTFVDPKSNDKPIKLVYTYGTPKDQIRVPDIGTKYEYGYTYFFTGWDKEITSVTGDVQYTAQYQKKANVEAVITTTPATRDYNGTLQEYFDYSVEYYVGGQKADLPEEVTATPVVIPAKGTNASALPYKGSVTIQLTTESNDYYIDPNENYAKDLSLTINPINATVTITGANNTTDYDGEEHSVTGYTATADSKLYDVTKDFTFSGTASAARTDAGTTGMGLKAEQFTNTNNNFKTVTFDVTDGYQTIDPIDVTVTIAGANNATDYDGGEHTVTGYTATADSKLYNVTKDFTFSGTASAARTDAGTTGMGLKAEQFTNTNSNFKTVIFDVTDGYQTVNPIDVTVTVAGNNSTVPYDGTEHSVSGYTATASSTLYDVTKDFTFSGTAEVKRTDAGTTNMGLAASQFTNTNPNFGTVTFNVTDGYQTITAVDEVVVTITGHNNTTDYDGAEHSVSGYDVAISNELYKATDFTFNGTAEAKRTDAGTTKMGLAASQFTNTNSNFTKVTFNVTDGYQTISPLNTTVTIVGENNITNYNGAEYSVTGYTATAGNRLYDVTKDFTFSGTAEAKRTDAGTTNMGLTASQFANTNPNFGTVTFNVTDGYQTISPLNTTVTIVGENNITNYNGAEYSVTGYTATAGNRLYDVTKDFTFSGTAEAKRTDAGTTDMGLTASQFANTNPNFGTVTFNVTDGYQTINPIDVTVTIAGNNSTVPYDGTEHGVSGYTATASSTLYDVTKDISFSGTASAARTDAGTTGMGLKAEQFTNTNSNFKTVIFDVTDGYQTVNPIDVTVTVAGNNSTVPYDGTEHSVSGYTATASSTLYDVAKDFTFSGTASAARTDAGTTNMGLKEAQFTNTNTNFGTVTFNVTDGYQKIDPIDVTVTIVGANNTTNYNGAEHSVSGYTATASSSLYDVTKDFTFSGTAEAKRTDAGTTNMGLAASQFTNTNPNFGTVTFNVTDGYQTITAVDEVVVTITGHNNTTDYDGAEHSVSGYDVKISNELYKATDFTFNGTAEAKRTDAGTTNMGLAASQFTNTNSNFTKVTFNVTDGYQTISPINTTVTIVGANNATDYDGGEHSVTGYTATAGNRLYDVTKDFTFSGTAEAKRTDAGTTNMGLAANQFANTNSNFGTVTFNVTDGYQTINPIDVTVTIVGANNTTDYDGTEHSVSGYTATADSDLYDVTKDFTFSGTASAARTDAGTTPMGLAQSQFTNTNSNFKTVTFNVTDGSQTITKRTVVMTSADDSREYNGSALTNDTVTVSGDGFIEGEGAVYNVTGTQTLVGNSSNSFTYTLNEGTKAENYTITQQIGTLTVTDRTVKYAILATASSDATVIYDGQPHKVTGFDTLTFEFDGNTYTVTGLTAEAEGTDADDYKSEISGTPIVIDAAGNDVTRQFTVSTQAGTLTIQPRPITLTSASDDKIYDGTPLTNDKVTVSEPGFVGDDGATYDVTGSQTLVETSKNTFTYTLNEGTKAENYAIKKVEGDLTVRPRPDTQKYEITVKAQNDTVKYDAAEHTISGFETLTFTENGQEFTVEGLSAEVKGTDAGVYTAEVTGEAVVRDAQGNDVTEQFIVHKQKGTLKIDKRYVILTSGSAEKAYEEEPLTNSDVTVDGDGFAEGEGATYNVTGSQSVVGSSENTFTYTLNEGTKASNYEIKTVNGLLKVKDRDSDKRFEITVTAKSDEVLYDGNTHTVAGLTTNIYGVNNDKYKVEGLSATTTELDAGTYDVNVVGTAKVLDESGNDVTNQFIVETVPGKLTINPRNVTLISASAEKEYDGKGLTAEEITVGGDGFVKNDGIVATGFSSRILVGSSENLFDYQLKEGTNSKNYNITVNYGTLSVINRDAQYEIWVAAPSETYMYDGTTHTYSGVEVRLTADGEAAQAEAGEEQNGIVFEINGVKYYLTGMDSSVETRNAGTYPVNITGSAVIKDENGNEVQDQFSVHTIPGVIEVQKRHVILTSGSVSEPYNGKVLANNQVTITGDGFVQGEGVSYNVTGSRTIVGIGNNTFDYAALEGTDLDNYDIGVIYGTLTVTNRDAKYLVTVTAQSGEFQYDGNAHTVSGLVSNIAVVNGETFNIQGLTATATATDAGEYPVYVTGVPRVYDAQNNDVTDQFAVAANDGTLRIRPVSEDTPDTYALTVRFVDEAGNDVADSYYGRYAAGEPFGPILAPAVPGMVPDYDAVSSDANGMPANDLTLEIIYRAAPEEQPAAAGNDDQNPPVSGGPGTDGTGGTGTDGTGTGTGEGAAPLAVLNQTNDQGETTTLVINDVTRPDTADETKTVGPIKEEVKIDEPQSQRLAIAVVNDEQEFELFDLEDTEVPLAAPPAGYWSIVNLLMALATIFLMILIAVIHFLGKKDETNIIKLDETEQEARRKRIKRILVYLSPIPAAAAFILFLVEEDMRRTVTLTDKWTLLFAAILLVQALLLFLSHRKRIENDEDEVQADF